jgi:RNA polymerase sigma-70 factor (ECF subfamily)
MASDEHGSASGSWVGVAGPGASQTDWGLIVRAIDDEAPESADALEQVTRRYWPAIYAAIRASGRDPHEAADLAQGFVCDVVLRRRLLARADPRRGRFRALLYSALRNYLYEQHRRATRKRRSDGGQPPRALAGDRLESAAADPARSPQQVFAVHWAATMIRRVLRQVQRAYIDEGRESHWMVFERRVARPMLTGEAPAPYETMVRQLGLKDHAQAANMVITVKRRVARALADEIRRTVTDPAEVQEELRELMSMADGRA